MGTAGSGPAAADTLRGDGDEFALCLKPGCTKPARLPSGCCSREHAISVGKKGKPLGPMSDAHKAAIAEALKGHEVTQETRDRIAATKLGIPRSEETKAKIAAAQTTYPPEMCTCRHCGREFGPIHGSRIRRGEGQFCPNCAADRTQWFWDNEPWRFPQSTGPGPTTFECDLCGLREVERWPSQVAAARAEERRWVCAECFPIWRRYLMAARRAVDELDPRVVHGPLELERLQRVARAFNDEMRRTWPAGRRGRRPQFADILVVEALFERGFTDRAVSELLGWQERFAEKRRHRAKIRRRGPGDRGGYQLLGSRPNYDTNQPRPNLT